MAPARDRPQALREISTMGAGTQEQFLPPKKVPGATGVYSRPPGLGYAAGPRLRASRQEPGPQYSLRAVRAPSDRQTLIAPFLAGRRLHLPPCSFLVTCSGDSSLACGSRHTSFHSMLIPLRCRSDINDPGASILWGRV